MSPSHSRHSSPSLSDDDIICVFLRIPPDDPARLVRASLVCRAWRRILTGPDFYRLYREFHGTPPMLGFVVSFWSPAGVGRLDIMSRFIPTTAFRLSADPDFYPHNWKAVDSRHGCILVELLKDYGDSAGGYIVWDPITNGRWGVPFPRIGMSGSPSSETGAVLCANEHCDHLGCHGPPFLVVVVASCLKTTSACVYSWESGLWSDMITLKHWDAIDSNGRGILVGNTLHFPFANRSVLQYNLGEQKLSVIDVPKVDRDQNLVFISAEDNVLVFAGLQGTTLILWSTEARAPAWAKRTVVDLEKLLPPRAFKPNPRAPEDESEYDSEDDFAVCCKPFVSGFTEGAVFLSTMAAGLFTVELNSGRTKKVAEVAMALGVIPWISFYTPRSCYATAITGFIHPSA